MTIQMDKKGIDKGKIQFFHQIFSTSSRVIGNHKGTK